jgi:uncharacterized membrane protein
MIRKTLLSVKSHLLTGLIILIPITVTYIGLSALFIFLVNIFRPLAGIFLKEGQLPAAIEFSIVLLITCFILYLVGLLSRIIAVKRLINLGENLVTRIPVAKFLYLTTKQILESVRMMKEKSLNKVVLVEYPRHGMRSFAFVTGKMRIKGGKDEELVNIFIPSTPNPTTGYMLMLPSDQVWDIDISMEEASKIIISGGLLSTTELKVHPYRPSHDEK